MLGLGLCQVPCLPEQLVRGIQHQPTQPLCPALEGFFWSACFCKTNSLTTSCYENATKKVHFCTHDSRGYVSHRVDFQMYLGLLLGFQLYSICWFMCQSCVVLITLALEYVSASGRASSPWHFPFLVFPGSSSMFAFPCELFWSYRCGRFW